MQILPYVNLKNNEDLYSLTFYQARGCLTSCHMSHFMFIYATSFKSTITAYT